MSITMTGEEYDTVHGEIERLTRQLTESQAREKRLIGTLDGIANADWRKWDEEIRSEREFVSWAKNRAQHAIVSHADRTALDALLRAERAKERERIAAWIEPQRNDIPAMGLEFAAAIRALGDE